jgi:hypothetical protein
VRHHLPLSHGFHDPPPGGSWFFLGLWKAKVCLRFAKRAAYRLIMPSLLARYLISRNMDVYVVPILFR